MARGRWLGFGVAAAGLIGAAFIASCGQGQAQEAIGNSSAPLTFGAVINIPAVNNEPSATWTPNGATLVDGSVLATDILCTGYNATQWAWSGNAGATWTTCGQRFPVDSGCNGAFGQWAVPDSGTLANYGLFGDATVVADKQGSVVFVTLGSPGAGCPNAAQGVVAIVSHDGGQTFDWSTATLVNDTSCSNGCQDQPDAAFDFTTNPPTLWIAFRHAGVVNPGQNGACVRRYFLDSTGHLRPLDIANPVNVSPSVLGYGIGAVRVRAGGGVTTVLYSTTESVPGCPTTGVNSQGVASVSSYDQGLNWSNNNVIINSSNYSPCVLSQQVDIGRNSRNYDYVRAMDGTNYVVFQDTKSTIRLYMDRIYGVQPSGRGESEWREWCAATATADAGPTTNWAARGTACVTPFYTQGQASQDAGTGNSLAWPTLASDDLGRLGVWVYEANSTDAQFHIHFRGNVSPRSPTSTWVDQDLSTNFTPGSGFGAGGAGPFRALGDYEAMAVRGALNHLQCGQTGTFFPVWTFANGPADAANTSSLQTLDGGVSFP